MKSGAGGQRWQGRGAICARNGSRVEMWGAVLVQGNIAEMGGGVKLEGACSWRALAVSAHTMRAERAMLVAESAAGYGCEVSVELESSALLADGVSTTDCAASSDDCVLIVNSSALTAARIATEESIRLELVH